MNDKHPYTLFKQRKHKSFNYKPRFTENNSSDGIAENSKRTDFISKWRGVQGHKRVGKGGMSIRILILVLVLLLICMYLLENKYM